MYMNPLIMEVNGATYSVEFKLRNVLSEQESCHNDNSSGVTVQGG